MLASLHSNRKALAGIVALALVTVAGGFLCVRWCVQAEEARRRDELLARAVAVARTIQVERIKALSFTAADVQRSEFQQLLHELHEYARVMPHLRWLYTMSLRDGRIVFGPDSLTPSDPDYSDPGGSYDDAPEELHQVFRDGRGRTTGIYQDQWGRFVSAFAPVRDPATGTVCFVVGIDVDAGTWLANRSRVQRLPTLFSAVLLLVLLGGAGGLIWRNRRLPVEHQGALRHAEAALCVVVGGLLTVAVAWVVHDVETHARRAAFSALARAQAETFGESLRGLRGQLEGLGRLFESSDRVERDEFRCYVEPAVHNGFSEAWLWLPETPAAAVPALIAAARREGVAGFNVWQPAAGVRVPVVERESYFPAFYAEPRTAQLELLGYDVGEAAVCREALEVARQTGRATATKGVVEPAGAPGRRGLLVFQPVYGKGGQAGGKPRGFVAVVLRLDTLLRERLSHSVLMDPEVRMEWFLLTGGQRPVFLTTSAPGHDPAARKWTGFQEEAAGGLSMADPLFIFGNAYALRMHGDPGYLAARPLWNGWAAAAGGLLLTGLVTAVVAGLGRQRSFLEQEVHNRTASLRANEARQAAILANIADVVAIAGTDGVVRYQSPNIEKWFGWRPEERLGTRCWEVIHPDDRERFRKLFEPGADHPGTTTFLELRYQGRDGAYRPVGVTGVNLCDNPDLGGVLVTYRDLTREKELQQRLQQSSKLDAIGRLAGGVAHDFNNLLQVIRGCVDLLLAREDVPPGLRGDLMEVQRAGEQAAGLTRQLLAFGRKQEVAPCRLDLNASVTGIGKMLKRLLGEDIRTVLQLAPDLQPVQADPGQVEQVIMNLAINARDAMPGGGQLILRTTNVVIGEADVAAMPDARPGGFVRLSVADTGSGMGKETLAHIFEPFFSTKGSKGTGLGLSVVYGIAKQSGGWVAVVSAPGEGTRFDVYLPVCRETDREAVPAVPVVDSGGPRGQGQRLLLVEDDVGVCAQAAQALQAAGYDVAACTSQAEAFSVFGREAGRFALLFSDVVLPDGTGVDLAERLRACRPGLPVLLCSGYTDERACWSQINDRAFRFLPKPYPLATLRRMVHELLAPEAVPGA
ncbi:MAG: CHASE domain-containing protein [Lentisphaeria bacterium]